VQARQGGASPATKRTEQGRQARNRGLTRAAGLRPCAREPAGCCDAVAARAQARAQARAEPQAQAGAAQASRCAHPGGAQRGRLPQQCGAHAHAHPRRRREARAAHAALPLLLLVRLEGLQHLLAPAEVHAALGGDHHAVRKARQAPAVGHAPVAGRHVAVGRDPDADHGQRVVQRLQRRGRRPAAAGEDHVACLLDGHDGHVLDLDDHVLRRLVEVAARREPVVCLLRLLLLLLHLLLHGALLVHHQHLLLLLQVRRERGLRDPARHRALLLHEGLMVARAEAPATLLEASAARDVAVASPAAALLRLARPAGRLALAALLLLRLLRLLLLLLGALGALLRLLQLDEGVQAHVEPLDVLARHG
jgi:hypothetical protein